jgi:hypothetical protein
MAQPAFRLVQNRAERQIDRFQQRAPALRLCGGQRSDQEVLLRFPRQLYGFDHCNVRLGTRPARPRWMRSAESRWIAASARPGLAKRWTTRIGFNSNSNFADSQTLSRRPDKSCRGIPDSICVLSARFGGAKPGGLALIRSLAAFHYCLPMPSLSIGCANGPIAPHRCCADRRPYRVLSAAQTSAAEGGS